MWPETKMYSSGNIDGVQVENIAREVKKQVLEPTMQFGDF